ncbi:CHAT domain-containing protein [Catellatospora sp. TT07R-123]|uniref:CHAT domain-containing tetratricopeptide repeat protein n=1 Tax=Catellatospora sp. TT07R-123 TaxID=2733863 RepID=UPI001B1931C1|nr:CHAT domain-containing tetratricopeptide repeat protein [Catellatospora sp. TT07R-123]GHJ43520.1 CHAT domain-containing protein [Catellatospora sp. TT07R-123]
MSIQQLTASLHTRVQAAEDGDPGGVLDEQAAMEAAELRAQAVAAGEVTIQLSYLLAWFHWMRFQFRRERADTADLHPALEWFGKVYDADPKASMPDLVHRFLSDGHSRRSHTANLIIGRVAHVDDPAGLDEAVALLTAAVAAAPPGHPHLAGYRSTLGFALRIRFERTGDDADLDRAVTVGWQAVNGAPPDHPELGSYLSNLGGALQNRFRRTGDTGDLDQAVALGRRAVDATPPGHPELAGMLSNLGGALRSRFGHSGWRGDLDEAVTAVRRAVGMTPPGHPGLAGMLSNLGGALRTRFEHTGAVGDLDEATALARQAVDAAPPGDPGLATMLSQLSDVLHDRFERTSLLGDLDEAVTAARQAVDAAPPGHPDHTRYLSDLGSVLRTRFERTGTGDLDEAVAAARQAVNATAAGDPGLAAYLSRLGNALRARFEHTGDTGDLDGAVRAARRAVDTARPGHQDLAVLWSNLNSTLQTRFRRTGDTADLDEAVAVGRQAVAAAPADHPGLAMHLSNLGTALRARFERAGDTGDTGDLREAVTIARQAVDAARPDDPDLASYLSNLGSALAIRFGRTSDAGDLDEAVAVGRQAVAQAPPGQPDRAVMMSNLADSLQSRSGHTGDNGDLHEAVELWALAAAADTAPAGTRLRAAHAGASATVRLGGPAAALGVYREAVGLLPLLAWRGVSDADRRFRLDREGASLARDGAACAIAAGDPGLAVELLEQGRGVVWAQLLDARTDLTGLAHDHPELARQLHECRAVLDRPPAAETAGHRQEPAWAGDPARAGAARRFDELSALVRALPPTDAFPQPHRFLLPPQVSDLLPGAGDGHVVMVNISRWRCDALILDHTGVAVVELPGLTEAEVIDNADRYLRALQDFERTRRDRGLMELAVTGTLAWLWDRIAGPVLERLGHTATRTGDDLWPRIWWCPIGTATVLPLHAAGHHTARDGRTVPDRVVSSYAPTLRALRHAHTRRPAPAADGQRLLVVALSDTPAQSPLPGADAERRALAALFPPARRTELLDRAATRAAITAALPRHEWLHASCHGTQKLADPASGGLVPYDWQTAGTVGIADLTGQAGGQFAFLSACKTATGGVTNLDETVTVAAALQYAGWRHVIGTLWSVWDHSAAAVTADLYPRLTRDGALDPARTAQALHRTTLALRDRQPARPSTWAPFIHAGP